MVNGFLLNVKYLKVMVYSIGMESDFSMIEKKYVVIEKTTDEDFINDEVIEHSDELETREEAEIVLEELELVNPKVDFLIVEINGAGSEPTHIYDPKHSLFFAWKELARHITYMYKISRQNHKKGISYLTFKEGVKEYKLHLEQSKKIIEM
jgi:hypothetical protein